jgi:hypothetical protein
LITSFPASPAAAGQYAVDRSCIEGVATGTAFEYLDDVLRLGAELGGGERGLRHGQAHSGERAVLAIEIG